MIKLSIDQAIAYYTVFSVIFLIGVWLFSSITEKELKLKNKIKLYKCDICAFVYSKIFEEEISTCPQCGCFNKKKEEKNDY